MEFTFDEENGVIIDNATGERCLLFPKAHLEHIFTRLTELFQSGAQVIISEAFKAAGRWYIKEISDKAKTDLTEFIAMAIERFKDAGLGRVELVEFKPETGELWFRIWDNLLAEIHHDDETYCFCVEAYLNGLIEQLTGKTPAIRKTKCLGKGDLCCEWYISLPSLGEMDKT